MSWAAPLSSDTARMRGTELGLGGKQGQSDHDDDTSQNGDDGDTGDGQLIVKELDRPVTDNRREGLRARTPDEQCCILEEVRHTDCSNQDGQRGAPDAAVCRPDAR